MELNEKQYLQSLVHVIRAKQRAGGWFDTKELADYIVKEIGGLSEVTDADEREAMERFLKSVSKGDTSKEFPRAVTDPDHRKPRGIPLPSGRGGTRERPPAA